MIRFKYFTKYLILWLVLLSPVFGITVFAQTDSVTSQEEEKTPVRVGQPKSRPVQQEQTTQTTEPRQQPKIQMRQGKLTLQLRNTDVIDVLKTLAEQGDLNIVVSEGVKGRITLFLENIEVIDALDGLTNFQQISILLTGVVNKYGWIIANNDTGNRQVFKHFID